MLGQIDGLGYIKSIVTTSITWSGVFLNIWFYLLYLLLFALALKQMHVSLETQNYNEFPIIHLYVIYLYIKGYPVRDRMIAL
jgi:hypothetical protein